MIVPPQATPGPRRAKAFLLALFALLAAAAAWRFGPWLPPVFYGDDLNHWVGYVDGRCGARASQLLGASCVDPEKLRPVFNVVKVALFAAFGKATSHYMAVNILLHGASALLVFAIARRLAGGLVVPLALAAAVATSRFALMQVTLVVGLVEGLAFFFFVASLYALVRAAEGARVAPWAALAVVCALLSQFSHERFNVMAVVLAFAFLALPAFRSLPVRTRALLVGACVAVPLVHIAYKLALGTPLFVGTGGMRVTSVDSALVLEHARQALSSTFGVNSGPPYLVGQTLASMPWLPAWLLAGAMILAWVVALAAGLRAAFARRAGMGFASFAWPAILLGAYVGLTAAALVTIRLEQRWLMAPFTLVLLVLAWSAGLQQRWLLRFAPAVVFAASAVWLDTLIERRFDQVYLSSSTRIATAVKRDLIDAAPGDASPVVLIAGREFCGWVLQGSSFFRVYGTSRPVACALSVAEALGPYPDGARFWQPAGRGLVEVTQDWTEKHRPVPPGFDFVARFSEGRISDERKVHTPTGRGVLVMKWDTRAGQRELFTLLSGFSYRFEGIVLPPGARLEFEVGMVFPARAPARALVRIAQGGASRVAFSRDLTPPVAGEKPAFRFESVPLEAAPGQPVTLTFEAVTPGPDASGHWVGFVRPRIVSGR